MITLWQLLQAGILVTALDIDNALYMTSAIEDFPPRGQRRAIIIGLGLEFLGRLAMIALFVWVFLGREMTLEFGGLMITPESVGLIGAGIFLLVRSLRELRDFFVGEQDEGETSITMNQSASFGQRMIEMTIVSLTLSIDTVVAVTGKTTAVWQMLYLLIFSALVRGLFVRQIATFIHRLPALNIIILTFLSLIGLELIAQGMGLSFPEEQFNLILMLAVVTAVLYERRRQRLARFLEKMRR